MRLPSNPLALLQHLLSVGRRFPLATLAALVATFAAQWMLEERAPLAEHLLPVALIGLPAFTAIGLWREQRGGDRRTYGFDLVVVAGLVALVLVWPHTGDEIMLRRVLQLELAALGAVAALPFLARERRDAFWAFNRTLFLRFVLSSLFVGVLFAGLGIAIWSLEQLFGVELPENVYANLMFALLTFFHPMHVLAGVPADLRTLAGDEELPRTLRVFAQSILMPLVIVYLLILLAYLARVLITQEWPSGWIGNLVSVVSVVGMLAVLLLDPLARPGRSAWVARASAIFHAAMIPALVMLFLAVGKRIEQHGVTENRYFLVVAASWLFVLCVLRTLRRWRDPWWVPASLALVALLTSAGPWGAYSWSERDQGHRLTAALERAGRLVDGRAVFASTEVDSLTHQRVSAVTLYLARVHGAEALRPWFDDATLWPDGRDGLDEGDRTERRDASLFAERAVTSIGLRYEPYATIVDPSQTWFSLEVGSMVAPLHDQDYVVAIDLFAENVLPLAIGEVELAFRLEGARVFARAGEPAVEVFVVDLGPAVAEAHRRRGRDEPLSVPFYLDFEGETWRGHFVVRSLHGVDEDGTPKVQRVSGLLLLERVPR